MLKRLAVVTDEFKAKIGRLVDTVVWRSPSFKQGKKYLTVHMLKDPEDPSDPGYFYCERVGTDSVAIVFFDGANAAKPFIVLEQFNSPVKEFVRGAFTGSMDKDGKDPVEIAIEEAYEEAGFTVTADRVHPMGRVPVGAMSNEQVHLFMIDVTGIERRQIHPENMFEANTRMFQTAKTDVYKLCEWKAALTVLRWEIARS